MYVYLVRSGSKKGAIKIGVASNVAKRLSELQVGNPATLCLIASIPCSSRKHAYDIEKGLHKRLRRWHIRGEWFSGKLDLKLIDTTCERWNIETIENKEAYKSNADTIASLKAKVRCLERTAEWQNEEIERLIETINARY